MESFRRPRGRPWLLLVVLGVAALVVWYRHGKETSETTESEPEPERVAVVESPVSPEPVQAEPQQAGVDIAELLSEAREAEERQALVAARARYLAILQHGAGGKIRAQAEKRLGRVNVELIFAPHSMPEKEDYIVKSGDSVQEIAATFGTTTLLIKTGNELENANLIKLGDRLRVFQGKFSLTVSRAENEMLVHMNGEFFKRYRVGTGKYERTPTGTFKILEKQINPTWWPHGREIPFGHPDNILGTRWMSLRATGETPDVRGYGIHGTWDNSSIGKSESAGCIRMINEDVEELFVYVPRGTPVTIVD